MICPLCHKDFPYDYNWGSCSEYVTLESGLTRYHYTISSRINDNKELVYSCEIIIIPPYKIINQDGFSEIFIQTSSIEETNPKMIKPYMDVFLVKIPKLEICSPDLLLQKIKTILAFS